MSMKTPCDGCRSFHVQGEYLKCDLDLLDWSIGSIPKTEGGVQRWYLAITVRFPIKCDGFAVEEVTK